MSTFTPFQVPSAIKTRINSELLQLRSTTYPRLSYTDCVHISGGRIIILPTHFPELLAMIDESLIWDKEGQAEYLTKGTGTPIAYLGDCEISHGHYFLVSCGTTSDAISFQLTYLTK